MGGYVWTYYLSSLNQTGDVDIESSEYWAIALDVNVRPGGQVELLYNRQDSTIEFRSFNTSQELSDVSVEYWQIGGLQGVLKGRVMPFAGFSLGATRIAFKDMDIGDAWKFSIILGLGAKAYLNERIGLRAQGSCPSPSSTGAWAWVAARGVRRLRGGERRRAGRSRGRVVRDVLSRLSCRLRSVAASSGLA